MCSRVTRNHTLRVHYDALVLLGVRFGAWFASFWWAHSNVAVEAGLLTKLKAGGGVVEAPLVEQPAAAAHRGWRSFNDAERLAAEEGQRQAHRLPRKRRPRQMRAR